MKKICIMNRHILMLLAIFFSFGINAQKTPEEDKEVFTIAEVMPSPKDGMQGLYEFIYKEIKYPQKAAKLGIEGKVIVTFIINADGSVSDVKAVKGIGGGCDEEAERVIRMLPDWTPGEEKGKKIKVSYALPVKFKLRKNKG